MMAQSSEFGQMAIREEELPELDALARDACHFDIKGGPENKHGKVNILLQASAALRFLHVCCTFSYQPRVLTCCWAIAAPEVERTAAVFLPLLMALSSPQHLGVTSAAMQSQHMALQASGRCACQLMSQAAAVSTSRPSEHCHVCCWSCLLLHYQFCKFLLL